MSGIFLSYRRDDSSGWAGRLHEHLVSQWGADRVFMDIDTIAPGDDFREAIRRTMETCDVVLVVIGPTWVNARDHAGNRRLDDEGDTHRAEVVAALAADIRVVPVLVGGTAMPKASDLPEPLRDLAYRNASVIEDRSFVRDVQALQDALQRFSGTPGTQRQAQPRGTPASRVSALRQPGRDPGSGWGSVRDGRGGRDGSSTAPTGAPAAPSTVLATAGTLLVLIWGVALRPGWHDELWGLRAGTGGLLVILTAAGLWKRQWTLVLAAGMTGVAGLALWMLAVLGTGHSVADLFSPGTDLVANGLTSAGALLVLIVGLQGSRGHGARRSRDGGAPRP